jgi:hypothetical protein
VSSAIPVTARGHHFALVALPFVPSVADEDFDRPMALTATRMIFTDPVTGDERTFHTAYTSTDF